jgi:TonB-dependent starch-binding outer membrane protein SusC
MLKLLLLGLIALLGANLAQAQTSQVTGKVTDEKNAAVGGATVTEKGTRNGTTTGPDGTFTLQVKDHATLVISFVGYENMEVAASPNVHITLNPEFRNLTDVVVTGIGVATSKKKVAIDVSSVSSKDFAKSATTSIEQSLDGQIAGAHIQQTSGTPGAAFNITLRGINSLDGTYPLIMLDGVEIRDLSAVDPASVDHIEVVKGAAGGMLYGAQGANGVIQVFTKKGSLNSKLSISFSTKVSIDNILTGKYPILSNHHHFVTDANNNILDQNGIPIQQDPTGIWTDPQVPDPGANPNLENNKTYNLPTYDHLKQAFRQAMTFTNSVVISGGGPSTDYSLTASQLNQQDVFSNNFSRTNFGINLGINPFRGFTFRTSTQVIAGYENLLGGNRFNVFDAYPYVDFNWRDSTGHRALKTSAAANQLNSLSEQEWHQRSNQSLEIFQNFDFNYKFPRFLELDIKYGLDYKNIDGTDYYLNQSAVLQPAEFWGPDRLGSLLDNFTKTLEQNALFSGFVRLDFQKDFNMSIPLRSTTQVTYDYRTFTGRQYFAQGVQLPSYPPVSISGALIKNSGDGDGLGGNLNETITTFGVLVNETLDYGNLFGISGGFRSDYGSAFGAASKPFTFPRGTVYFRPSEFLSNVSWLTDWKLRAAYGKAGVQPGPYDRQTTLNVSALGTGVGLSLPSTASNDSLHIAVSTELEVGTDLSVRMLSGAWLNRITLGGTYWTRTSSDVYQQAQVAPSTGYASRLDNLSTIESHGVDLSLDASMYNSSNVIWTMGVRWGTAQSKVTKIFNGLSQFNGVFAVKQGANVGLFYGQTVLHSITQLKPDGQTPYIPVAQQGDYTIVNGTVVNKNTNSVLLSANNDQTIIGKAYPDFTSSIINTVTLFKDLTISFQFDWIHGNNIYNLTKQWLYTPAGGSGGSGGISADFDKKINVAGNTGSFVNYYQSLYNLVLPTSWFVENGSYVRLRDLSLTYDLKRIIRVNAIKRISATLSGRNLLTFTKYTGMDPENTGAYGTQGNDISNSRVGAFSGVDYFGVPNLKSYQFSLNFGF